MKKLLLNKKILLTRKFEESEKEFLLLKYFGAEIICFPAISVTHINNSEKLEKYLYNGIDIINFSSVNSVKHFFKNLGNNKQSISSNIKVFAVGAKTAEACKAEGLIPETLPENYSAKGLLKLYATENITEKKILIPASTKARKELPEGLKKLGAKIIQLPVYSVETTAAAKLKDEIKNLENGVDLFAFTSPSNFQGFLEINSINDPVKYFTGSVIAAIGKTTKKAINDFNLNVEITPEKYTVTDLVSAIIDFYDQKGVKFE